MDAAGEEDAFMTWVAPHLPRMGALAARLASPPDRDDIVQMALLRAWSKRNQYDAARGAASVWLMAITANEARKSHRFRRAIEPLADTLRQPIHAPEGRLDLLSALRHLARRQRLAVDCFYFAGLTVAETAAVMGCSEGTVKSTLADARAALRRSLGDGDV